MEEVVVKGGDGGLKKPRSNEDISRGSVEAGLGNWKDCSKLNRVGAVDTKCGSDPSCVRPPSIPRGRFGRGERESPSDKRLFFERSKGSSADEGEYISLSCELGSDGDSWILTNC